jgi:RNA polymerase sigma factor (sigma-70 family)
LSRGPSTTNGATLPAATLEARAPSLRAHASDEQLARAAGRGDAAAFEALYERHHLPLLSFARHMLGGVHDAEDVVQHTFLAADRQFRAGKLPGAVRAWLYTVARNRCVSMLRARREAPGLPDAAMPSLENLAAEVEQREDLRNLLDDVRALPDDQRAALLLAELGDLSHPEVAKVIGTRPGKVKALVFQARETLMAAAHARAIPCRSIQEELAVANGSSLRRRHLRNHLAHCRGCREYADSVRAQRASLALILPVVPTVALRDTVLSGLVGGTAAGASAGATAGGVGLLAAKSSAAKLLTIAAVGGAAAGGGTAAITAHEAADRSRAAEHRAASPPVSRATAPVTPVLSRVAEHAPPVDRLPARSLRKDVSSRPARTERTRAERRGAAAPEPRGHANGREHERAAAKTPPGQAKTKPTHAKPKPAPAKPKGAPAKPKGAFAKPKRATAKPAPAKPKPTSAKPKTPAEPRNAAAKPKDAPAQVKSPPALKPKPHKVARADPSKPGQDAQPVEPPKAQSAPAAASQAADAPGQARP